MKREEALEHFNENYVKVKSLEKLNKLDKYYEENKDTLAADFVESIRLLCIKINEMQEKGENGKIAHIVCSMLRTNVIFGVYKSIIESFDRLWYFGKKGCEVEYDASWAFGLLDEFEKELMEIGKLYIGKIIKTDIERFKLKEAVLYNERIIKLARYAMPQAALTEEFKLVLKEDILQVRVGEYRNFSKLVYKEAQRTKDSKEIKFWLQEKQKFKYTYEVLRELDLSDGDYEGIDISYSDFGKSNISKSNIKSCKLTGAKFCECLLEETDFSEVTADEAVFDSADLRNAVFRGAKADRASFRTANLEGACFEGADLSYSDMRGANLINANFDGAVLNGTIFLTDDIAGLNLNEEHMKDIVIKQ
jgi:uncharacterized protein YjbI with pentapeptide repeats